MLTKIYHYLFAYLYVEIIGTSPERFLNMCIHHEINLWGLKSYGEKYRFYITVKNFRKLRPLIQKTGIKITILRKKGFPFILHRYRKRYVFIFGLFFTCISFYVYSLFIWNIDISGNSKYTEAELLSFLNKENVYKTMKVDIVDTAEIVSLIRNNFPDIIWVSTHVQGSNLVIRVKENQQINKVEEENITTQSGTGPYAYGEDIVASEDGVVVSIVTSTGVPQVHAGDVVEKGDILILGRIDVTNDADELISYNYTKASGEIILETTLQYEDSISMKYKEKVYTGELAYKKQYIVGDYFFDPKLVEFKSDQFVEENTKDYILHPSQQSVYQFIFRVQTLKEYYFIDAVYTKDQLQDMLSNSFNTYKESLLENGMKIIENNVKISLDGFEATARGNLVIETPCTQVVPTDILKISEFIETEL